jgi:hypothetical protein
VAKPRVPQGRWRRCIFPLEALAHGDRRGGGGFVGEASGCVACEACGAGGCRTIGGQGPTRGWVAVVAGVGGAHGCGDPRPSLLLAADVVGAVWVATSSI